MAAPHPRAEVGTWLLAQAAGWLDLGGVTRLLAYAETGDTEEEEFLGAAGFQVLTRTIRSIALER